MAYSVQQWNDDDPTTPLSASRLNHLETQYSASISEVIAELGNTTSPIYSAVNAAFASNEDLEAVTSNQYFNYGIRPVLRFSGTVWPARAASIPQGYTGNVDYDSADFTGVPSPSDMVANDRWIRQTT